MRCCSLVLCRIWKRSHLKKDLQSKYLFINCELHIRFQVCILVIRKFRLFFICDVISLYLWNSRYVKSEISFLTSWSLLIIGALWEWHVRLSRENQNSSLPPVQRKRTKFCSVCSKFWSFYSLYSLFYSSYHLSHCLLSRRSTDNHIFFSDRWKMLYPPPPPTIPP